MKINFPAGRSIGQAELSITTDFPEVPDTLTIYKIIPPIVTLESVTKIGNQLGFGGAASLSDLGIINMFNPELHTELHVYMKSGTISYICTSDEIYQIENTSLLPTSEEAKKLAEDYLQQKGFLHSDVVFSEVVEGSSFDGNVTTWAVGFNRQINGLPTLGTGAHFGVRVGISGKVVELFLSHPDVQFYQNIAIKSPAQAFEELRVNGGTQIFKANTNKILIDKAELGYWMNGITQSQDFLLPAYEFSGKCYDAQDKYLGDFTGWVEAVEIAE